jgi:hypothetical protein
MRVALTPPPSIFCSICDNDVSSFLKINWNDVSSCKRVLGSLGQQMCLHSVQRSLDAVRLFIGLLVCAR